MNVELRFFATFREAVGQKTIEREFSEGATVGDVLRDLEAAYDGLDGQILESAERGDGESGGDADASIRPQISVLLNGREVLHMEGLGTPIAEGDTLSVFPPVAGGSGDEPATREKSFRGISIRLARNYLENLGGEAVADDRVEGDGWVATLSEEEVEVGPTMQLTEVTVAFEGDPDALSPLVEDFSQKAMRAGG